GADRIPARGTGDGNRVDDGGNGLRVGRAGGAARRSRGVGVCLVHGVPMDERTGVEYTAHESCLRARARGRVGAELPGGLWGAGAGGVGRGSAPGAVRLRRGAGGRGWGDARRGRAVSVVAGAAQQRPQRRIIDGCDKKLTRAAGPGSADQSFANGSEGAVGAAWLFT